jgi:hypothetical protein
MLKTYRNYGLASAGIALILLSISCAIGNFGSWFFGALSGIFINAVIAFYDEYKTAKKKGGY